MKAVFETAALADSVKRANSVAPTKGEAADRAAGIVVTVPDDGPALVQATDIETTFTEQITVQDRAGDATRWRFPASVITKLLEALPQGGGETLSMEDDGGKVLVRQDRTKAKLNLYDEPSYPRWGAFRVDDMEEIPGLAQYLKMVSWCTRKKGEVPLDGIHIDGDRLVATDTAGAAEVRCKIPVDEPITVPLAVLSRLISNTASVALAVRANKKTGQSRLYLLADDNAFMTALIYEQPYPQVGNIRKMVAGYDNECRINGENLVAMMRKMLSLCERDRYPQVDLKVGPGYLHASMNIPQYGEVTDEMDIGGGPSTPLEISFTPGYLTKAVEATGEAISTWRFGDRLQAVHISIGDNFDAYVMPRRRA